MALIVADRVQETCTSPGTGTITLLGAVTQFQTFSATVGNANTTFYVIADQSGSNWEVGIGTYTSVGNTLARTTVLASSNAGSLVNFATGTQNVWGDLPAGKAVYKDADNNVSAENLFLGYTDTTSSGTTTTLSASSNYYQKISGTSAQTFTLPDATTLPLGAAYIFDNDSTGSVTVNDFGNTLVDLITSGSIDYLFVENNSTSAGSWGKYSWLPAAYNFSTTTADFGTASVVAGSTQFLPSLYYRKNTATTLTSATGNQSIFGLTNGVTVAANTTYLVECEFELTTTGTTSHTESFGFTLATATVTNMGVTINRLAANTTSSAIGGYLTSVTPVVVTGALTTAQTVTYRVKGTIAFGTGGSINPVIAFSAAPAGTSTIILGPWMRLTPVGATGANITIGTWA